MTADAAFDPGHAWRRAPGVALRPEPFGALAYDFTTRRLSFLKSRDLVRVVAGLENAPSALDALDATAIPAAEHPRYLSALAALAGTGMIIRRTDPEVTS
jgi:putative mycofactocin binding protein MftB